MFLTSQDRHIVSSDIQTYSTIINKALLNPVKDNFTSNFIKKIKREKLIEVELKKFKKIINFENQILKKGDKNINKVCNFLENCSIYNFIDEKNNKIDKELKEILSSSYSIIKKTRRDTQLLNFMVVFIFLSNNQ